MYYFSAHKPTNIKQRAPSLDYLRGLAAFGIMVFHYSMWTFGDFHAEDFLGRVGYYGVSVFYVLSGITLYYVYYDKIGKPSRSGLIDFGVKRIFRIYPLLWLANTVTVALEGARPLTDMLLFYTGASAVVKWHDSLCYGAWSIGNELVFYLFFPVLVALSKRGKGWLLGGGLAGMTLFLWCSFVYVDITKPIDQLWIAYTNPLNQVFYFIGGFLIAHFSPAIRLSKMTAFVLALMSVTAFIFYPLHGDSIQLVQGIPRLVFTILCLLLCFSFYRGELFLAGLWNRIFSWLGEISYSLYLLHPLVWSILKHLFGGQFMSLPAYIKLTVGFSCTLVAASMVYRMYERYFMRLGKNVATRWVGVGH